MVFMRVLIDQNVDDRVQQSFRNRGHSVFLVRELLGAQAADTLIAVTACDQGFVVVTHDKHYRRFQQLIAIGARNEYAAGAGRISLSVTEPRAAVLLEKYMRDIEYHFSRAIEDGQRLLIRITENYLSRHDDSPNLRLRT
jgi:hypothetical protein